MDDAEAVNAFDHLDDFVEYEERLPLRHLVPTDVLLQRDVVVHLVYVHPVLARLVGNWVKHERDPLAWEAPRLCRRLGPLVLDVVDEHPVAPLDARTPLEVLQQNVFVVQQHLALNHFLCLLGVVGIVHRKHFELEKLIVPLGEIGLDAVQRPGCVASNFWSSDEVANFSNLSAKRNFFVDSFAAGCGGRRALTFPVRLATRS